MNDASSSKDESVGLSLPTPSTTLRGSKRPPRAIHTEPVGVTLRQDEHYWRGVCEERGHIACEMHDGLLSHLHAAALRLQNATEVLHGEPGVPPAFRSDLCGELAVVHQLLHLAVAETRGWLQDEPPTAGTLEDLESAVRHIAAEIQAASDTCRVLLAVDKQLPPLPARTRWELMRVSQEALRNAVRHGHARSVELRLEHLPSLRLVQLCVQDDGCGFDPFAPHPDGFVHFGLKAMRSRVERLGGRFAIKSHLQAGTTVTASIPVVPLSIQPHTDDDDILHHPSLDH